MKLILLVSIFITLEACSIDHKNQGVTEVDSYPIDLYVLSCIESSYRNSEGIKELIELIKKGQLNESSYTQKWYNKFSIDEIVAANDLLAIGDVNANFFITPNLSACNFKHDSMMNHAILEEYKVDKEIFAENSRFFYQAIKPLRSMYLKFFVEAKKNGLTRVPPHISINLDFGKKLEAEDSIQAGLIKYITENNILLREY